MTCLASRLEEGAPVLDPMARYNSVYHTIPIFKGPLFYYVQALLGISEDLAMDVVMDGCKDCERELTK